MERLSAEQNELTSTDSAPACCVMKNALGYSLKEAVVLVAGFAIVVSIVTLITSVIYLLTMPSKTMINSNPINAINLLSALVCSCTSVYEIVISIAMLWFLRQKQFVLLLTLWAVSNITLLALYSLMIVARTVIYFRGGQCLTGFVNAIFGIIYEVVFSYFVLIVSNYEDSLDPNTVIY